MKLYAVLLGGSGGPDRLAEDHETVFVVAENDKDAKAAAKTKWSGYGRGHVDAIRSVDVVDGHAITLVVTDAVVESETLDFNDIPFDED